MSAAAADTTHASATCSCAHSVALNSTLLLLLPAESAILLLLLPERPEAMPSPPLSFDPSPLVFSLFSSDNNLLLPCCFLLRFTTSPSPSPPSSPSPSPALPILPFPSPPPRSPSSPSPSPPPSPSSSPSFPRPLSFPPISPAPPVGEGQAFRRARVTSSSRGARRGWKVRATAAASAAQNAPIVKSTRLPSAVCPSCTPPPPPLPPPSPPLPSPPAAPPAVPAVAAAPTPAPPAVAATPASLSGATSPRYCQASVRSVQFRRGSSGQPGQLPGGSSSLACGLGHGMR
ncbi:unnamed protein product [Closterium sp. NIES-54]